MLALHKVENYDTTPLSGTLLKGNGEGKSFQSQHNSGKCTWLFILLGRRICEITYQFMSCDQCLADGEGLRRNTTGKLVTRKFRGKVCDKPLWMDKNIKIFASYWMPKGWPWKRKIFIIRWVEWPILWIPLSLFPQPSLSLPNGFIYKVAKVTRIEVMHGLSNTDLHSSKPIWLWPLLSASSRDQHWVPHVAPFTQSGQPAIW